MPMYLCGSCDKKCKDDAFIAMDSESSVRCNIFFRGFTGDMLGRIVLDDRDLLCPNCRDNINNNKN